MSEKEKLVEELKDVVCLEFSSQYGDIANFILADRKRIVQPLVDYLNREGEPDWDGYIAYAAIDETLTLAGITEGK